MNETQIDALYANNDYMTAYAAHTDARVTLDPEEAVGGAWEQVGQFQFHYLIAKGLRKDHKLLDIGCGTLRGGRYFIEYLDCGGYTGLDISPKALELAKSSSATRVCQTNNRGFYWTPTSDCDLRNSPDSTSISYRLNRCSRIYPKPISRRCFSHIGAIMKTSSFFYFTFLDLGSLRDYRIRILGIPRRGLTRSPTYRASNLSTSPTAHIRAVKAWLSRAAEVRGR